MRRLWAKLVRLFTCLKTTLKSIKSRIFDVKKPEWAFFFYIKTDKCDLCRVCAAERGAARTGKKSELERGVVPRACAPLSGAREWTIVAAARQGSPHHPTTPTSCIISRSVNYTPPPLTGSISYSHVLCDSGVARLSAPKIKEKHQKVMQFQARLRPPNVSTHKHVNLMYVVVASQTARKLIGKAYISAKLGKRKVRGPEEAVGPL